MDNSKQIEQMELDRGGVEFDDDVYDVLYYMDAGNLRILAKAFRETLKLGFQAGLDSIEIKRRRSR